MKFNKDLGKLRPGDLRLLGPGGFEDIQAEVIGKTVVIRPRPNTSWQRETTYRLIVETSLRARDGSQLKYPVVVVFEYYRSPVGNDESDPEAADTGE